MVDITNMEIRQAKWGGTAGMHCFKKHELKTQTVWEEICLASCLFCGVYFFCFSLDASLLSCFLYRLVFTPFSCFLRVSASLLLRLCVSLLLWFSVFLILCFFVFLLLLFCFPAFCSFSSSFVPFCHFASALAFLLRVFSAFLRCSLLCLAASVSSCFWIFYLCVVDFIATCCLCIPMRSPLSHHSW